MSEIAHPHEMLKVTEAAAMLRVSRRQFDRLWQAGRVPAPIILGPQTKRWRRVDLERFIEGGGMPEAA